MSLTNDNRIQHQRGASATPTSYDPETPRDRPKSTKSTTESNHRQQQHRDSRESQRERVERYGSVSRQNHARNESGDTGVASSGEYRDIHNANGGRRHDYDVQSMETDLPSPRTSIRRNPIPAPTVTVRSEFPTLSRSRQQQSLTCLITIEVPEGKWSPDPEDLRTTPSPSSTHHDAGEPHARSPTGGRHVDWPSESQELLEAVTEDLRVRVDNWHGLEFQRHAISPNELVSRQSLIDCRFGKLRLFGTIRVGKDRRSWQELECFLFAEMLICVKEKRGAPPQYADGNSKRKLARCTLKGSILIKKHLKQVESVSGMGSIFYHWCSSLNARMHRRPGPYVEPFGSRAATLPPAVSESGPARAMEKRITRSEHPRPIDANYRV